MTLHRNIPPAVIASLSDSQRVLLEYWWELPNHTITPIQVFRFRGGTYQSATMFLRRLNSKLGGYVTKTDYGSYSLAAVGEVEIPPEFFYARIVFGKEMTPFDTIERFATKLGIDSLTEKFHQNAPMLTEAMLNFLNSNNLIDPETILVLEAYRDGMAGWVEAFRVFQKHFDVILKEAKEGRGDTQLLGDKHSLKIILEES